LKKTFAALAFAAALIPFASAQAAVISFSNSIGMQETDWSELLRLNKFDTKLGTLQSVQFDLSGVLQGSGEAENKSSRAAKVTISLGSEMTLTRPDGSLLVMTNPLFKKDYNFSGYDRVLDFGGTSGARTGLIEISDSDSFISLLAGDLALFSAAGGGFIDLGISAIGHSEAIGSGNMSSNFENFASASATVTYTYDPVVVEVPEPATLATMVAGLGLIGAARRRRAAKKA